MLGTSVSEVLEALFRWPIQSSFEQYRDLFPFVGGHCHFSTRQPFLGLFRDLGGGISLIRAIKVRINETRRRKGSSQTSVFSN